MGRERDAMGQNMVGRRGKGGSGFTMMASRHACDTGGSRPFPVQSVIRTRKQSVNSQ